MLRVLALAFVASALGYHTPAGRGPQGGLDRAFARALQQQEQSAAAMQRHINQLVHPDVQCNLVFNGVSQPAILPGSATTDHLHALATRLHKLQRHQPLRFVVNGEALPNGLAISESPLALSQNLEVHVTKMHQAAANAPGNWWTDAATASGGRRALAAPASEAERAASIMETAAAARRKGRQQPVVAGLATNVVVPSTPPTYGNVVMPPTYVATPSAAVPPAKAAKRTKAAEIRIARPRKPPSSQWPPMSSARHGLNCYVDRPREAPQRNQFP